MPIQNDLLSLDGESLTIADVVAVAHQPEIQVTLRESAWERVRRASQAVQDFVARGQVIYGITTGFGAFKDKIISKEQVEQLQRNILVSHAVGVGQLLDQ
ncbi:MAG: aromatic amino acid lyase, partial [Anaerolineales bacterium]